ncbi:hypothetical protein DB30_01148 [Enhygromyxa salina]|uniref:Uncharacterized protein n=1 Tax=Enhygromyxa salina TaxID=215803 RepID=A0A0C2CSP8_9BACT|nr:hypothetical protein [Enhygromyxa salina]KIG12660.1 hypothetical protein DB30_01148 [Enhygromyxa salina]
MTAADLTTSASAQRVAIHVDDVRVEVLAGTSLAAALLDLRIGDHALHAPTDWAPNWPPIWPPICAPICAPITPRAPLSRVTLDQLRS